MSYDGWLEFNGVELVNLSRTAQLAEAMGVTQVWTQPGDVSWIETALGADSYDDITTAPWYDAAYPASAEFAGIVPLSFPGLGDSTKTASTTEYLDDGGTSSRPRSATLPIVASVVLVASTDAGAEYGKRWLNRVLAAGASSLTCIGSVLRYFRYADAASPIAHHRDVKVTRGTSITRRVIRDCQVSLFATFTLTANDPFEYGELQDSLTGLGTAPGGPGLVSNGTLALVETPCPVYNYDPIYDPLYPALVAPPTAPDFLPDGWTIEDGDEFTRKWAIVDPIEPSSLRVVPVMTLTTPDVARMVRVSIWPSSALASEQCDPLFSAVVTYLPGAIDFTLDGEQKAAYVYDGVTFRRTDSLVYSPDARPVDWAAFTSAGGLLVALDTFNGETVTLDVGFVSKSE